MMAKLNKNAYNDSGVIFVMVIVMLVSFIFFYLAYDNYKWLNNPSVLATFESCDNIAEQDEDGRIKYEGIFKYKVNGKEYKASTVLSSKECNSNTKKEIYYDKDNPEEYKVGNVLFMLIVSIILALAFFLIPLFIIIGCIKDNKKKKRD
jgi:uncharacterized membrane protein